ncbi:DUF6036 family nucleotidyltransferase [Prosthecobacter sp. SYSU 5D2]|uniref:DUF6036 family nucleotidyltransferase n=1 Tax=Prosthecobacter sp. SYSU 5D2 TaxID=3134134 RepID=UPI0031FF091D
MRSHTTAARIESLMREMGRAVRSAGRVYFTGGVSAVLLGWREMTIDVDLKAEPEPLGFFECLPHLKDSLDLNIELASPDQFVPVLPGWQERSRFIAQHGLLTFYHYDFYGQALSKIERDHPRDRHDVACMMNDGLVQRERLKELFLEVEAQVIRYPAIDAPSLKQRVLDVCGEGM